MIGLRWLVEKCSEFGRVARASYPAILIPDYTMEVSPVERWKENSQPGDGPQSRKNPARGGIWNAGMVSPASCHVYPPHQIHEILNRPMNFYERRRDFFARRGIFIRNRAQVFDFPFDSDYRLVGRIAIVR